MKEPGRTLTVALVGEVFFGPGGADRLARRLADAAGRGADLALLPELPLDPWVPATDLARDEDAEGPTGPRHQVLCHAAREAGIALVGGAIVRDPATGCRNNTSVLIDRQGRTLDTYRKLHIPREPGFFESSHYEGGDEPPRVVGGLPLRVAVQICSDIQRPVMALALAAAGAEVVLVPRATEQVTWPRWELAMRAVALAGSVFVLSANRPAPEQGVGLGGPSVAIAPGGEVLVSTTEPLALVTLDADRITRARKAYPGYLAVRGDLYARAWAAAGPVTAR